MGEACNAGLAASFAGCSARHRGRLQGDAEQRGHHGYDLDVIARECHPQGSCKCACQGGV